MPKTGSQSLGEPRSALITGASSGIGTAFANLLAAQGHNLVLTARRADRLEQLATELRARHGVTVQVLAADLADPKTPEWLVTQIAETGAAVDILINNAGYCGNHTFVGAPWETSAGELQLMVTAPTELAHRVAAGMAQRGYGRIVNLSSQSAFFPPGASWLYTAIKTYVLQMSQTLDMELKPQGIHVTALCPGNTRTEFHTVMGAGAVAEKLPPFMWQDADTVAAAGWAAVEKGTPVCIPGTANKVFAYAMRSLPANVAYKVGRDSNPFKDVIGAPADTNGSAAATK